MPAEEFRLYQKLFDIIHQQLFNPTYLFTCMHRYRIQQNIKKRNRAYEQGIPDEYLFNIQETYTNYIKQHNIKTLFIDAGNADFLGNPKHLHVIINALNQEYEPGQHYFTLP